MRPNTARSIAMVITVAATAWALRTYDPEAWKPVGAILAYSWVIIPAWVAYALIDAQLMEWFGNRTADGTKEVYIDPVTDRLDRIERAINRLYRYVQELDPELAEERYLEEQFKSGQGGMWAGMDYLEYVQEREKVGKRTIRGDSIWHDERPQDEHAIEDEASRYK